MIVVPNVALLNNLSWFFQVGGAPLPPLQLSLYVNDLWPNDETVMGDFVKATGSWYQDQEVTLGTWSVAVQPDDSAQATFDTEFQWTSNVGAGTVFGYYVYDPVSDKLSWCERFDVPIALEPGREIKLRPRFSRWSRYLPSPP